MNNTPFYISAVVTPDNIGTVLMTVRKGIDIYDVTIHVIEAFNDAATLKIGHASNDDAFSVAQDVTTTGRKRPTLGAEVGYQTGPKNVLAALTGTPTQGRAIVVIEGRTLQQIV